MAPNLGRLIEKGTIGRKSRRADVKVQSGWLWTNAGGCEMSAATICLGLCSLVGKSGTAPPG
jgi:hypothetical protein